MQGYQTVYDIDGKTQDTTLMQHYCMELLNWA